MVLFTSLDAALLIAFALATFACYRLSYLITKDKLFVNQRDWLTAKLTVKKNGGIRTHGFRYKLAYVLNCPICMGVWVSLAIACILGACAPWSLGVAGCIFWLSVAGAQTSLQKATSGKAVE